MTSARTTSLLGALAVTAFALVLAGARGEPTVAARLSLTAPAPTPFPSPYDDEPARRVAGIVLAPDGSPAAGIVLHLRMALLGRDDDGPKWRREQVKTDRDGRFVTRRPFPAGRVRVDGELRGEELAFAEDLHAHHADEEPCSWTLHIVPRPVFRLRILGAGEIVPSGWQARVAHVGPDGEQLDWPWERLEGGDPLPRIRYSANRATGAPVRLPRIEVRSRDGIWRGATAVATARPADALVVDLEVERVGTVLAGRVLAAGGDPIAWAHVDVTRIDETRIDETRVDDTRVDARVDEDEQSATCRTDERGRFELDHHAPGTYRVVARCEAPGAKLQSRKERVVDVGVGRVELEPFVLDEIAGAVSGRVRYRDEDAAPWSIVRLRPAGGDEAWARARVIGDERYDLSVFTAHDVEAFDFDKLPAGTYELALLPPWPGAFEPQTRTVVPPASGLVLELRGTPVRAVRLRLLDRATREPIEGGMVCLSTSTVWRLVEAFSNSDGLVTLPVPESDDAAVAIHVLTGRHSPALLQPQNLPRDGTVFDVPLERGWGTLVRLRRASPDSPWRELQWTPPDPELAGVALHAGGEHVATTDTTGTATIALRTTHAEPTVPGWRVVARSGPFGSWPDASPLIELEPIEDDGR